MKPEMRKLLFAAIEQRPCLTDPDRQGAALYARTKRIESLIAEIERDAVEEATRDKDAEIVRLLQVQDQWSKACSIAERYFGKNTPVGKSFFDFGIPKTIKVFESTIATLTERVKELEGQIDPWICRRCGRGNGIDPVDTCVYCETKKESFIMEETKRAVCSCGQLASRIEGSDGYCDKCWNDKNATPDMRHDAAVCLFRRVLDYHAIPTDSPGVYEEGFAELRVDIETWLNQ